MSLIKPNHNLIKKIQLELIEISKITIAKQFDKDIVKNKIHILIQDLTELNTIQKDILDEYKEKNKELFIHMKSQTTELAKITNTVEKYSEWNVRYMNFIKNNVSLTETFIEEGKRYENIIESSAKNPNPINQTLVKEVLGTYLQIKFTRKRKRSIWWNYQFFRFNIFYRSIVNMLISSIVGYSIEKSISAVFSNIPDIFITLGIGVLFFFTLEKNLGKKFETFFWKVVQKQSLSLYFDLNLYLQQIKLGN